MITNKSITIYHYNGLDVATHLEKWKRYNYKDVSFFDSKSANINSGYTNSDNVQIRIPFGRDTNIDINNFAIGDIVVEGTLAIDIETQQDLENYNVYNITSIKNNNFGNNPHIHLGGN